MLDAGQHKKKNGIYRRGKLTCKEKQRNSRTKAHLPDYPNEKRVEKIKNIEINQLLSVVSWMSRRRKAQ